MLRSITLLAGLMLLTRLAAAQDQDIPPDRIVPLVGSSITNVRVAGADAATIVYARLQGGGGNLNIPRADVKEISWGDTPNPLRQAMQNYRQGTIAIAKNDEKAAKAEFERALNAQLPEKGPRDFWYQPFRRLFIARCQIQLQKPDDALTKLDEITTQFANSMYATEAWQEKLPLFVALKKLDRVAEVAAALDPNNDFDSPDTTGACGKLWQLKARLAEADAAQQINKTDRAKTLYPRLMKITETLIATTPVPLKESINDIKKIRQQTLVGYFEYLYKSNSPDASTFIEKYGMEITDPSIRGRMFSKMGDIYFEQAEKMPNGAPHTEKYTDALYAYLRVQLLFGQAEVRPHAMLRVAIISALLGSPTDKARAKRVAQELVDQYPNLPEAAEGKRLLTTLGSG